MEKKSYKKSEVVYCELENFCRSLRTGSTLPTERILANMFGCSRVTMRKVIELGRFNGIICRVKSQLVVNDKNSLRGCGKILFVTSGVRGEIALGAWVRLWNYLERELDKNMANYELFLYEQNSTDLELKVACEAADVIILTHLSAKNEDEKKDFIKEIERAKHLIAITDPLVDYCPNYIALDNYAVGALAAKTLLDYGCKKVVYMSNHMINESRFTKRLNGFRDYLTQRDIKFAVDYRSGTVEVHYYEELRNILDRRIAQGADGIFFDTDEAIGFVAHKYINSGLIPEKVKLLTLHGRGDSTRETPPISAISHATKEVVDALIVHLHEYANSHNIAPIQKLIQPQIYLGDTLGAIKK